MADGDGAGGAETATDEPSRTTTSMSSVGRALQGKRVTVMGLGTRGGGLGVARFLAEAGALVTVTDAKPAEALAEPLALLAGLPLRFKLGGHDEIHFTPAGADLVVRNPGVPRRAPLLALARRSGVPVEMEMSLFLRLCPAPVIGVTGTSAPASARNRATPSPPPRVPNPITVTRLPWSA